MSDTAQIDSVDDLIDAMAEAISPYAFGAHGSETEKSFSRSAAVRAMRVCVPVVLEEAARMVWAPDEASQKCVSIIKSLRSMFE